MIISRTPFRISFTGGGTDLESFWHKEYGAVLSCTIDKYMFITVNPRFDHTLRISYSKTEIVEYAQQVKHPIVREALNLVGLTQGIEITSIADIPSGTGLGSSSSFTVGLLHALYAYKGEHASAERLAREACRIEIVLLKEPIGKQDQYIASYGGLQYITFQPDGSVFVDPIICRKETKDALFQNLMMFYTGITREARTILESQNKKTASKRSLLRKMRDLASDMREVLREGKTLDDVGNLLHEGWMLKKELVGGISSAEIDRLYIQARDAGALGGKILGAGGGGFILLYVEKQNQDRVRKALSTLKEISVNLEPQGSKIIYVGD